MTSTFMVPRAVRVQFSLQRSLTHHLLTMKSVMRLPSSLYCNCFSHIYHSAKWVAQIENWNLPLGAISRLLLLLAFSRAQMLAADWSIQRLAGNLTIQYPLCRSVALLDSEGVWTLVVYPRYKTFLVTISAQKFSLISKLLVCVNFESCIGF